MKKTKILLAVMITMAVSVTMLAKSQTDVVDVHHHDALATHAEVQGAHCRGFVGCDCPGFSPVTNGKVWEQAYCKHCRHKREYHR